jgi:hypothetical protein
MFILVLFQLTTGFFVSRLHSEQAVYNSFVYMFKNVQHASHYKNTSAVNRMILAPEGISC